MGWDHTFVHPLGPDPYIFHMQPLTFYLDEFMFNKEVTSWPRVTVEKKKRGVSYALPAITQRSSPTNTLDVGPRMRKRTWTPSILEEEAYEGEDEALSSDTL
jgi:hypothetical protein